MEKQYMNVATGSVDTYDGWFYEDADGNTQNAVDNKEVVEVQSISFNGVSEWVAVGGW